MFISKFIKLLGHYVRYPVDILLLPVSILFGYFHGGIKMYAVLTLNVVSFLQKFVGCPIYLSPAKHAVVPSLLCPFPLFYLFYFSPGYFIGITPLFTVSVRKQ
jgi:hypothetical protein